MISGHVYCIVQYKKINKMRTLNISVSESEYERFGLKEENISFAELLDILKREIARQNLREAVKLGKIWIFKYHNG